MKGMILTKYSGTIIGPIALLLGMLMDGIFRLLNLVGIPNVGLSIIIFTFLIYLCMLPLTFKQQKFSKLSSRMNPELQAVTSKYRDKKDNESMMKMKEETDAIYAKYGVSQSGMCLPLLIQMPIFITLYRVIASMPAYVTQIKNVYIDLVTKLSNTEGAAELIKGFSGSALFEKQFKNEAFVSGSEYMQNTFIDVLNNSSTADWAALSEKFPELSTEITQVVSQLNEYNNFLGLNIGHTPLNTIKDAFASGEYLLVVGALLVPLLAAFTQWFNTQLMPQQNKADMQDNPMMASMRTMNVTMPILSAIMCFSLPAGMGIYWIAGSVFRSIQQIAINKYFDKINVDELIEENQRKYEEKQKKLISESKDMVAGSTLKAKAAKNTKNIEFDYNNYYYETKVEETSVKKKKNKEEYTNIAAKANKLSKSN